MTNVIVLPQDQIQTSQLELQTHNNTPEIGEFGIIVLRFFYDIKMIENNNYD